jgi:hypothetical protein
MLHTFAQVVAEVEEEKFKDLIGQAIHDAAGVRPGEFLMAVFGLALMFFLLRHLNKKDIAFSATVEKFSNVVDHINSVNQDRNEIHRCRSRDGPRR